jgi:hypothetical protein
VVDNGRKMKDKKEKEWWCNEVGGGVSEKNIF